MTGRRLALVIANGEYEHQSLQRLRSAPADAAALVDVLADPAIADFEVEVLTDATAHEVLAAIEDRLSDVRPDDLVLLHFSGHGLKDESGALYLAARNTRPDRLGSTAVPADFVQRSMNSCRARRLVLLLDCCYGGAFGRGVRVRASGSANVMDAFPAERIGGGRGRVVISAASSVEFAFEGDRLTGGKQPPSVFTQAVVAGLSSGEADLNGDGLITLDELYDYVFDKVRERNPRQSPTRRVDLQGDLVLARSVLGASAAEVPPTTTIAKSQGTAYVPQAWPPAQLAVAGGWMLAIAAVLVVAAVFLPLRYGRAMSMEAPPLVPLAVGCVLVTCLAAIAMLRSRSGHPRAASAAGWAITAGIAAIELGGVLTWALTGVDGFTSTGTFVGLAGCLIALVGSGLGLRMAIRADQLELDTTTLRSGAGIATVVASLLGAAGAMTIFATAHPYGSDAQPWFLLVTAALALVTPLVSDAVHPGGDTVRWGWAIIVIAVATSATLILDPYRWAEGGSPYGADPLSLNALGIGLMIGSVSILLIASAIRRWRRSA